MAENRPIPGMVVADCEQSDLVGAVVYPVSESKVSTCDPLTNGKMGAIGVIVSKPNSTRALIKKYGRVDNARDKFIGHTGRMAYIDIDGQMTPGPPKTGVPGTRLFARAIGVITGDHALELNISPDMIRYSEE